MYTYPPYDYAGSTLIACARLSIYICGADKTADNVAIKFTLIAVISAFPPYSYKHSIYYYEKFRFFNSNSLHSCCCFGV